MTLYELGEEYEKDIETLKRQIERAKQELVSAREKHSQTLIVRAERKLNVYMQMLADVKTAEKTLKNYYRNSSYKE